MLKNIDLALNDANRVGLQMSEWIAQGDWRLFFIHRDRLRKVTPDEVNRVATLYLKASNRTVGSYYPTEKPERTVIPEAPAIDSLVKDYKGDAVVAAGFVLGPVEDLGEAAVEDVVHQRRLAGSADPGDCHKAAQRE